MFYATHFDWRLVSLLASSSATNRAHVSSRGEQMNSPQINQTMCDIIGRHYVNHLSARRLTLMAERRSLVSRLERCESCCSGEIYSDQLEFIDLR